MLINKLIADHKKKTGGNPGEARDRSLSLSMRANRHAVAQDELDRASSAYKQAGAVGAVAGGLAGSLKGRTGIGAGLGLLAGLGSVKAIRAASAPDEYGQRTPAEHEVQSLLPVAVGSITAAVLARKKLRQMAANASKRLTPLFPI